jgi:NADH dehydrogenase
MENKQTSRIVIVGAGFAGLTLALELERRCGRMGNCDILLLDHHVEHLYTPLLYEVATGGVEENRKDCEGELRAGVCIRFEDYTTIIGSKHVRFKRGTVVGLDLQENVVRLEDGPSVPFHLLALAPGSETNTFNIPGLDTHGIGFKTLADAFRIRDRLHRLLSEYQRGERKEIRVVVGGGGATGTEFSAEVANFFDQLVRADLLRREDVHVTLVEAIPTILAMLPPRLQKKARRHLEELGVSVKTETAIERVEADAVFVRPANGGEPSVRIAADLIVWAGGIRPASLVSRLDLPKDKKGRIVVAPTGRVDGQERVFALGDAVAWPVPGTEQTVPALAQAAVQQAKIIAENMARMAEHRDLRSYRPPVHWKTIVPLGGKFALADLGPVSLFGMPAYFLRKGADLRYFLSILPFHYAWHMWVRGAKMYIRND